MNLELVLENEYKKYEDMLKRKLTELVINRYKVGYDLLYSKQQFTY